MILYFGQWHAPSSKFNAEEIDEHKNHLILFVHVKRSKNESNENDEKKELK